MGGGVSKHRNGLLCIIHENKVKKIFKNSNFYYKIPFQVQRVQFDRASTSRFIQEQLAIAVGLNRYRELLKRHRHAEYEVMQAD
jgi:hypothetical protein